MERYLDGGTQRSPRRAEYWEHMYELFPGAIVLDDLASCADDEEAAKWVIVRYAAVRSAASLLASDVAEHMVKMERSVGLNHLRSVPMLDREAWSLKRMLGLVEADPVRELASALIVAGDAAAARGHIRGAFAEYLVAYRLARRRSWHAEAGQAARGIERVSRSAGAVHSPRLWRRRARVMEKRAAVA